MIFVVVVVVVVVFWGGWGEGLFVVVLLFLFSFGGGRRGCCGVVDVFCFVCFSISFCLFFLALAHFHVAIVGACGVDQNPRLMTVSTKTQTRIKTKLTLAVPTKNKVR